jgi:hypothetical protein
MNTDKQADDIVNMIDSFMSNGGGHINVTVNNDGEVTLDKKVSVANSLDCAKGDMACSVPTLFEGMDADINDEK